MFTLDGFFYNAWFSYGLSLKHLHASPSQLQFWWTTQEGYQSQTNYSKIR